MQSDNESKNISLFPKPVDQEPEAQKTPSAQRSNLEIPKNPTFWAAALVVVTLAGFLYNYLSSQSREKQHNQDILSEVRLLLGPAGEIQVSREKPPTRADKENYEKAKTLIDHVLEEEPRNAEALTFRGIYEALQGKVETAEATFREAIRISPDHARAVYDLGAVILRQKDRTAKEALELFTRAAQLDKTNPFPDLNRGITLRNLRRYAEAREAFEAASEKIPTSADPFEEIGLTYLLEEQPEKALDPLRKATQLSTESTGFPACNLGYALYSLERYDEAVPVLREATTKNPKLGYAYSYLALSLAALGHIEEAKKQLDVCLENAPEIAICHKGLARIYETEGNRSAAIDHLKKAVALVPEDLESWKSLVALLEAGDKRP